MVASVSGRWQLLSGHPLVSGVGGGEFKWRSATNNGTVTSGAPKAGLSKEKKKTHTHNQAQEA